MELTKELVVASLLPELTKLNWQQLYDAAKNIQVSKETLGVNYSDAMRIRDLWDLLKKRRALEDKADRERIKARKEGYEVYMKPLEEILERLDPEFHKHNAEIKAAEKIIADEINKKNEIMASHIDFVNNMAKQVMEAPDAKDLARVQMLVGTEKSRTKYYGDYHDKIKKSCDDLLSLIDDRKKFIKENAKLYKDYEKAIEKDDMPWAVQIKEEIENNQRVIHQNALNITQEAYQQVSAIQLIGNDLISASITPRTHRWSWKVDDMDLLFSKKPELVELSPNTKAINKFMKEKVDADELSSDTDNIFDGLILYRKPFYVGVKTKGEKEEEDAA